MLGGGLLQAPRPVLVKEHELVKDALNVLIGVVSTTFPLCQVRALMSGHRASPGLWPHWGPHGVEHTGVGSTPSAGAQRGEPGCWARRGLPSGRSDALFSQLRLFTSFYKLNKS